MYFDLTNDSCFELMDKMPDWIKDKIKASPEYVAQVSARVDSSDDSLAPEDVFIKDDDDEPLLF